MRPLQFGRLLDGMRLAVDQWARQRGAANCTTGVALAHFAEKELRHRLTWLGYLAPQQYT